MANWLKDERRFWTTSALLLGAVAALKGLHLPGAWPLTAAELDYSQGFVKRGLLGWVYGHLGLRQHAGLSVAFFLQLLALLLLLAVWARRTGIQARLTPVLTLFAASYATTFLFHMVGYSDILNASLLVCMLLIRRVGWRLAVALPLCVAGLLVHENFLLLFAPVILLSFWLDGEGYEHGIPRAWWYGAALAVTLATAAAVIFLHPQPDGARVDALADIAWHADFPMREDYYQILTSSIGSNLKWMLEVGWHRYSWLSAQVVGLFVFLPTVVVLMHSCRGILNTARANRWTRRLVWVAALSPLLLNVIGLDGMRWDMWVVIDSFLVLGLLLRRWPGAVTEVDHEGRNVIILVLALSMASGWGLFEKNTINPYPFFPRALRDAIQKHDGDVPGF